MGRQKYASSASRHRHSPRIAEREAKLIKEIENSVTKMMFPTLKGFYVSSNFLKNVFEALKVQFKIQGPSCQFNDRWITKFRKQLEFTTGENFDSGDKVKKVWIIAINHLPKKMLLYVISVEGGGCKTILTEYDQDCLIFQKLDSSAEVLEDLLNVITKTSNTCKEPKPSTSKANRNRTINAEKDQILNIEKKSRDDVAGSNYSCGPKKEDELVKKTTALKNANHPVPTLWDEPMDVDFLSDFNEYESALPTEIYSDLLKDAMDFVNDDFSAPFFPFECNDLDLDSAALFPERALNAGDQSQKRTMETLTRINVEVSNSVKASSVTDDYVNADSFSPTQQYEPSQESNPNSFQNSYGEDSVSDPDQEFIEMDDDQDEDSAMNLSCHERMESNMWDMCPLGHRQLVIKRFSTN